MEKEFFESNDRKIPITFHKCRAADEKQQAIGSEQTQIIEKVPEYIAFPPENTASAKANAGCTKENVEFLEKRSPFEPLTFESQSFRAAKERMRGIALHPCKLKPPATRKNLFTPG